MANEPWLELFWQKSDKPTAFDCYGNCAGALASLKALDYRIAIRYYDHTANTKHPSDKILRPSEVAQIFKNKFDIVAVYESTNNLKYLDGEKDGLLHGRRAGRYATEVIHQPLGSAIYFAVDLDIGHRDLTNKILPYFRAVQTGLRETCAGGIAYRVGVYGSGTTCAAVLDAGLAQYAWLANAVAWSGYADFDASGRWHLKQQRPRKVGKTKFEFDPNFVGKSDVGQFSWREIQA